MTDFDRLMARGHDASAYAYAFDLLAIDDRDVRSEPLEQRKAPSPSCCAGRSPASV